ncbi:MAG: hypothetical protein LBL52_04140 [Rickettsiales bacterium]|nr:hypothetical protein [Rickettsiales bacterium]
MKKFMILLVFLALTAPLEARRHPKPHGKPTKRPEARRDTRPRRTKTILAKRGQMPNYKKGKNPFRTRPNPRTKVNMYR